MLQIMKNEKKLFQNWLYKYVKIDKMITGVKLADKIGCHSSTITSYIKGRTGADFKTRQKILEATDTSYADMIDIGSNPFEVQPKTQLDVEEVKKIVAGEMDKYNKPPNVNKKSY